MEINVTPVSSEKKARKKKRNPENWKRTKQKRLRYSAHCLPVYPTCGHKTSAFQCTSLTMSEVQKFHRQFYEVKNKIFQDNFILKYCKTAPIKRERPKNSLHSKKLFQTQFVILTKHKTLLPVCKRAFMEILCLTRRRVDTVTKNYFNCSLPAKENRGGNRKLEMFKSKRDSVINFINKFKVIESHYCRGQSMRLYLDSNLSIKKMWNMYMKENVEKPVKESYFRNIFNTKYNLGFGSPRTDVCSTCLQLTEKIKTCNDQKIKTTLLTERKVHKMKAQAYFKMIREPKEGVALFSFDCQKNQVLPKVPDQQAYYSRQIYMFNFAVVKGSSKSPLNPSTVSSFCWTENEYRKGSNEIASCLYHILQTSDFTEIHTIRLMCDGCAGQNKNTTLMAMCCTWLANQNAVKVIEVVFPIRGHSFIPPDRVFGHIEKECCKREIILEPDEYLEIFSHYATVYKVGTDVQIHDWKSEAGKCIKPPGQWHFAFAKMKRMVITKTIKGIALVRGESNYNSDIGVGKSIGKKGKIVRDINPDIIPKQNNVSKNKKTDVNNLLISHYGEEWKSKPNLKFYKYVVEGEENDETDEPLEILCESLEDDPIVAI